MIAGQNPGDLPSAGPRKRRLGRPPTLDRDAVLRAARNVIAERGFDRTRYADVAEAASVPVTTLQHAFGSLQAMLLESVQRATASEIPALRDLTDGATRSPWERLSEFVVGAADPPDDPNSWLVWLELWRLAGRDAEIGAHAGVLYAQWWEYVTELIELGTRADEFSGPLVEDPRAAAQAVVAVVDGLAASLVMRADGPDHARVVDVALRAVATMVGYEGPADRGVPAPAPALAIAVGSSADAAPIVVDGPVPAAEPISADGPLPGEAVGGHVPAPRRGGLAQPE